ncbi:Polyketide cyclase / dehydrase and lipid transport [Streptoalloteichus tenebrarius]|uniref:Polyketide cyclase / dehydrase and lipid transport n=1 Tax=Streptoalloteichus tenebrarius (strain ATCC 17920 / DSM 40477 / JCM 4838 / CBS 697.72 / NBRC 16177 / NCIMB 11028 / NRRL B-12390 / A12253. 1 / ISP 5477) TaxID=1933 RepID=A0ABT1I263_STRSD|nr:SRPBCC family protein [Streptoalloteichus tenebrarius]MCP2261876.1 Polyketide cyclase / dehydrase and lipid transport [Streptoalloteichus tenebrarius]BFF01063.1 SRPBCC family protein [Streptoalloteichus tenebrarius]
MSPAGRAPAIHLELTTPVAAPPEVVFAAATDWTRQREWMLGTQVHVVAGSGHSVGSRLVAFTGAADLGFLDTMEITVWDPPRRCEVRHLGRLLRGFGVFSVRPHGRGAVFVWEEHLHAPLGPLGVAGWTLLGPLVRWGLRRSLTTFASFCQEYPR